MKANSMRTGPFPLLVPLFLAFSFPPLFAADRSGKETESALPAGNLVVNGDFEQGDKGWPADAFRRKVASVKREGGNSWLSISGNGGLTQSIKLDPQWAALRVSMRLRVTDVVPGKEGWHDARLAMNFVDAQGEHLDPWPNVFHARGTGDWVKYDRVFKIPANGARLELAPSMFGASGTADFDAIQVTVARMRSGAAADLALPGGAEDLRDSSKAWRQTSATRQRICLNGLWRFLPAGKEPVEQPPPPGRGWGWFKVPGIWPKSADDAQQILLPNGIDDSELRQWEQAWYQRPLSVPAAWSGRKTLFDFTMVQTHARVWIDGREAGEVFFPGGLLDITKLAKPGAAQTLTVLLTARPLEKESNVFMAPQRVIASKAVIERRGLGGGRVIFCQMDVTGRTDADPAALALCSKVIRYLDNARPAVRRPTQWAGDQRTADLVKQLGIAATQTRTVPAAGALLILGAGATIENPLRQRIEEGLDVLALGLSEEEIARALPGAIKLKTEPTVSSTLQRFGVPLLAGISNAELHWRTKLTLAAMREAPEGANQAFQVIQLGRGQVVLCQAAPWMFDFEKKGYLRTTYRRNVFLISRLLHNLGAGDETTSGGPRYLQTPQSGDDPYRYYRW